DGIPDLATANEGDDSVSVLLGTGGGRFGPPRVFSTGPGTQPFGIAAGDFNGDGIPDLVVSDGGTTPSTGQSLSVLLGNGDGTLQPPRMFRIGPDPCTCSARGVAVADFNGDGRLDIAVADGGSTVDILFGNGDGTFRTPVRYPVGAAAPASIVVADFNRDGKPDIAVDGVFVLLNRGDGTFSTNVYGSNGTETSLAAIDLKGDGVLDIVAVEQGGGLSVLMNRGDGTFVLSPTFYLLTDQYAGQATVGDFDGDGTADVAIAGAGTDSVLFLPGRGDGTFGPGPSIQLPGKTPTGIVAGDWNT